MAEGAGLVVEGAIGQLGSLAGAVDMAAAIDPAWGATAKVIGAECALYRQASCIVLAIEPDGSGTSYAHLPAGIPEFITVASYFRSQNQVRNIGFLAGPRRNRQATIWMIQSQWPLSEYMLEFVTVDAIENSAGCDVLVRSCVVIGSGLFLHCPADEGIFEDAVHKLGIVEDDV